MSGTVIEDNGICGAHRSGLESAGGYSDLTIRNNKIHDNASTIGGLPYDANLKYGHGILLIRGASDKLADSAHAYGPVNLTIEDNEIYDNGKSGIYMGPMNHNYQITGNSIHGNGRNGILLDLEARYWNGTFETPPDPADKYAVYDGSEDLVASDNAIFNNGDGDDYGIQVNGTPSNGFIFQSERNYWGADNGPSGEGPGSGDAVSDYVSYSPWWADAAMTTLVYENNATFTADYTVHRGETLEVPGTLAVTGGTFKVDGGTLIADTLDLQDGATLEVVDGELTLDGSTLSGSFTFFNSMGSVHFDDDVAISGSAEGLILISDVHVADGATITVDGTLVIDGSVIDSDSGAYSLVVNPGASFTMARTVMSNCAMSLGADGSKVYDNRFISSTIEVTSGTTGARVYHNLTDDAGWLTDNGAGTVTSVDSWGNITDPADTENNLTLDLDITGLVNRTTDADGNIYIQPDDTFTGTIDVSALQAKIAAVEMLLGYNTDFLSASSLTPEDDWDNVISSVDDGSTIIGKLDAALGLSFNFGDPDGTDADQRLATVELTGQGLEGQTIFFQRVKLAGDAFGGETRLTTGGASPAYLTPFTANSGAITLDGTPPSIDASSVNGTQVQASAGSPVDVLDPDPASAPDYTFRNGNPVVITFTATDAGPAGIDLDDLDNDLALSATDGTTTLDTWTVSATEDASGVVSITVSLEVPATTPNGSYAVSATLLDRSGNQSATADLGTFEIANELLATVELQGFEGSQREVTFVATDASGAQLASWVKTVEFNNALGSVSLEAVPDSTAAISAKTAWNLRSKVAASFTSEGVGTANLTGADLLPGGDLPVDSREKDTGG